MKKIISLMLAVLILSLNVFAASNISFEQMDSETYNGFVAAIKEDGCRLFNDLYSVDSSLITDGEVTSAHVIANVNGNYIIEYVYAQGVIDNCRIKTFGDFAIKFWGCGYCVYSAKDGKVMSIEKAYNDGLITEEDLLEIQLYYIDNKNDNFVFTGARLADANSDGVIDVVDLAKLRNEIINSREHPITVGDFYIQPDINKDGFVDIIDVVKLRDMIVNNK